MQWVYMALHCNTHKFYLKANATVIIGLSNCTELSRCNITNYHTYIKMWAHFDACNNTPRLGLHQSLKTFVGVYLNITGDIPVSMQTNSCMSRRQRSNMQASKLRPRGASWRDNAFKTRHYTCIRIFCTIMRMYEPGPHKSKCVLRYA